MPEAGERHIAQALRGIGQQSYQATPCPLPLPPAPCPLPPPCPQPPPPRRRSAFAS
jgi:hypothetical protein